MKAYLYQGLTISSFLTLICPSLVLASNAIDPGILMYKAGYLEQAKEYYEAEITAAPKQSAGSHYMLANILMRLHQPKAAKREYHRAAALDPFGSTGKYSRFALEQLNNNLSCRSSVFQSNVNGNISQSPTTSYIDNSSQQKMKNSVRTISAQIEEEERRKQAECDERIKQIATTASTAVEQIKDEMNDRIAANGLAVYGSHHSYNSGVLNEIIVRECRERIKFVRSQASYEIDKVKTAYQEKLHALEDSALAVDKSYLTSKQSGDIYLNPAGSNIYLRYYQTDQSPSGAPVPVMAAPGRLLPDKEPKSSHQGYVMWVSLTPQSAQQS